MNEETEDKDNHFLCTSQEEITTYLEASATMIPGKINIGITEWATSHDIEMTMDQARSLGGWLLKVAGAVEAP